MSNIIEQALQIALNAHKGQTAKAGKPYILHPLRVMAMMDTEEEMVTALLHDVLEDSNEDIRSMPYHIIDAVVALTKSKGTPYDAYIKNVSKNTLAKKVKLADLCDNMDLSRLNIITEADKKRVYEKYQPAYEWLMMGKS